MSKEKQLAIVAGSDNLNKTSGLDIGVLTFHRCINYGSYWQTRCLVEGLQRRGHNAVVLDHQSRRVNLKEWKCAMQPVLPTVVPKSDYPLYRQKIESFFSAFDTLVLSPSFSLEDPTKMEKYDLVVVGSDEVWNLSHPWYGYCPLFYGDGIQESRLVSYAASFGNYDFSWGIPQDWSAKLSKFDNISVRDENSKALIKNSLGIEPEIVLDPCLQFPVELQQREKVDKKGPYVAVYGHNFSGSFAREVRKYATHRGLPLISIGYRNDWADEQWITADPFDFAYFMACSEAVATNFFHGCVFALRSAKPFACETTPYRSHKIAGLMREIGAEGHLVNEDTEAEVYPLRLTGAVDEEILQNIEKLRVASDHYLDQALGQKKLKYL